MLLKSGIDTLFRDEENDFERWVTVWNHMDEFCGALIRADAYGYDASNAVDIVKELMA